MGLRNRHVVVGQPGRPTRPSAAEITKIAAQLQRRRAAGSGTASAAGAPAGRPASGGEAGTGGRGR